MLLQIKDEKTPRTSHQRGHLQHQNWFIAPKDHGQEKCGKRCDYCSNFVDETSFVISKAAGQKYLIWRDSTHNKKYYIFDNCTKSGEQGTISTVFWKFLL